MIFVLEIKGAAVLAFEADNMDDARAFSRDAGEREDLTELRSNGAPLWNGTVIYPQPILAQPLNHGPQSISGPLNMTGYPLINVSALGVGTSTPSFPVDVENGYINTNLGYLVGGGAGTIGQCLVSNGTYFGPGSCGSARDLQPVRGRKRGAPSPAIDHQLSAPLHGGQQLCR